MINRLTLRINMNIEDNDWTPGLPLINDPQYGLNDLSKYEKDKILNKFCQYLARKMRALLKYRINTQYNCLKWAPLSTGYEEYKRAVGLSPNIWKATGFLVDSIKVYKKGGCYVIGINPNLKYPKSNVSVLFVAECMEFGTRYMPARPLFAPTIRFMRRHVRKYWEAFLVEYQKKSRI